MKRAVIALMIAAGLIAGCGKAGKKSEEIRSAMTELDNAEGFQTIAYGLHYYIVVDEETRVMYAVSNGMYNTGNLTLLVDANGKPRLWEGE